MLLKRTIWMKSNLWHTGYIISTKIDTTSLYVCKSSLGIVFDVPHDASMVRFYLYDRPAKNRVKCQILGDFLWIGNNCVHIANYFSKRMLLKFQFKSLYLECEYIESEAMEAAFGV